MSALPVRCDNSVARTAVAARWNMAEDEKHVFRSSRSLIHHTLSYFFVRLFFFVRFLFFNTINSDKPKHNTHSTTVCLFLSMVQACAQTHSQFMALYSFAPAPNETAPALPKWWNGGIVSTLNGLRNQENVLTMCWLLSVSSSSSVF